MTPNKIKWFLGSASLAMIMEQERKHWLLKTDKKKQVQDMRTGDAFQGRIDNVGSDIIVETEKLPLKDPVVSKGKFSAENVSNVLELAKSVFPYTPMLNGLHFMRITSINLMTEPDRYNNYRLKLTNCQIVYVPMLTGEGSDTNVFVYRWLKTTDTPVLESPDGNDQYTITNDIRFSEGVTNPVYYFPFDETLQTIPLTTGSDILNVTTVLINTDDFIGLPLLWFTCDESDKGPKIVMTNVNTDDPNSESKLLEIGSASSSDEAVTNDPYRAGLYPSTGDENYVSPDGTAGSWVIICHPIAGKSFDNTENDLTVPLKDIIFAPGVGREEDGLKVDFNGSIGNNVITMARRSYLYWSYVDDQTYAADLSEYASNTYQEEQSPQTPAFDVVFDRSYAFEDTTTDAGFAGMRFGASKNYEDQFPRYPHDINNLEGLPDWIRNNDENLTPQHLSIYALHNTASYNPADQQTRQIAGLIFDPGVERSYEYKQGFFAINNFTIVDGGMYYMVGDIVYIDFGKNMYAHNDPAVWGSWSNVSATKLIVEEIDNIEIIDGRQYGRVKKLRFANNVDEEHYIIDKGFAYILNPDGTYSFRSSTAPGSHLPDRQICDTAWNKKDITGLFETCFMGYTPEVDVDYYNTEYSAGIQYQGIETNGPVIDTIILKAIQDLTRDEDFQTDHSSWCTGFTPSPKVKIKGGDIWYDWETAPNGHKPVAKNSHGRGLKLLITEEDVVTFEPPITATDYPNEETGRVYLISNDKPGYENNARAFYKKPARTIARICDIPTSIMQLTNIKGLAPTSIVDKKYVRSEASFTEEDLDYILNGSKSLWVRPIHLDSMGHPIYDPSDPGDKNPFVFNSKEDLLRVDLIEHNDFRTWTNINPKIDPEDVKVYDIPLSYRGSGYAVESTGLLIIGGFAFEYFVTDVDGSGGVLAATIAPSSTISGGISLSNFDMLPNTSTGITVAYGTSPLENQSGTGLKLQLQIDNWSSYQPKKGNVFENLYAFVRDTKGIYFYYRTANGWKTDESCLVAEANNSSPNNYRGEVTLHDSYINSIIPSYHRFEVALLQENRATASVGAFVTPAMINVVDSSVTPVMIPDANRDGVEFNETVVDINKFYCQLNGGLHRMTARNRTQDAVIEAINSSPYARFESFVFWKWVYPNSTDPLFEFGVIYRSLDNLVSTDVTSTLPPNDLIIDKYVSTNGQTTIMWNVPHVGPMVWMFDPQSTIHETYYVNAHTRDPYVVKNQFRWENIEVVDIGTGIKYPLVIDGFFQYYLLTNMSAYTVMTDSSDPQSQAVIPDNVSTIYGKTGYRPFRVSAFYPGSNMYNTILPRGSWRLVFPTSHSFKLKKIDGTTSDIEYTPTQMKVIRGAGISDTSDVLNDEGIAINYASLLLDENVLTNTLDMRLYNQDTGSWQTV